MKLKNRLLNLMHNSMKIEMIFLFFLGDYVIDKIKMIDYIYNIIFFTLYISIF